MNDNTSCKWHYHIFLRKIIVNCCIFQNIFYYMEALMLFANYIRKWMLSKCWPTNACSRFHGLVASKMKFYNKHIQLEPLYTIKKKKSRICDPWYVYLWNLKYSLLQFIIQRWILWKDGCKVSWLKHLSLMYSISNALITEKKINQISKYGFFFSSLAWKKMWI